MKQLLVTEDGTFVLASSITPTSAGGSTVITYTYYVATSISYTSYDKPGQLRPATAAEKELWELLYG